MPVPLKRHPDSQCQAVTSIDVDATRPHANELRLRYVLAGRIVDLRVPPRLPSERKDELWQHTCLEVFIRAAQGEGYAEFNLSPSTQWAAYEFSGYRNGMRNAALTHAPQIDVTLTQDRLILEGSIDLDGVSSLPPGASWRLALSAVIEETNGRKSYWAFAHPSGKADFHHRDSFAYNLPLPARP